MIEAESLEEKARSLSKLPLAVRMEMLVGLMADKLAEIAAHHRRLTVRPSAVRMREDLRFLIQVDLSIHQALQDLRAEVQRIF
jgi:hypothetical protein